MKKKRLTLMLIFLSGLFFSACFAAEESTPAPSNHSSLVYPGPDGRLVYKPYIKQGDKIIDYSYFGYKKVKSQFRMFRWSKP
jgi:hypothetical protein